MRTRAFEVLTVLALVLLALLLRTRHIVGFGLGDDAYYGFMSNQILQNGLQGWSPDFGSNYRFGLWLPIGTSFRLFGVDDLSFVLFPLVSSALLVAVVYLLGRKLADPRVAFFAALVQAVSTFDIAFATTMTIDIPVTFLLSLSLLLMLWSEDAGTAGNILLNFLGASAILWAYFMKLPAPSIMLVFGILTLLRWQHWKKHFGLYGWFGVLLGLTFLVDYRLHGDPLNYLHNELKFSPKPSAFEHVYHLYTEWMFTNRNWIQAYLFGFHFFLGTLGTVYCLAVREARRQVLPFLIWWATMFLFLQFIPGEWKLPYLVIPRFFRYTHVFIPPASLVAGVFLASLWTRLSARGMQTAGARLAAAAFAGLLLGYVLVSASQGLATAALYRDEDTDARKAALLLESLPRKPIYCDNNMHDKFNFYTGYQRLGQARWDVNGLNLQSEIVEKRNLEPLRGLSEGYVVFGGARGVALQQSSILTQGSFEPPPGWRLVFQIDEPLGAFRKEPLRIYDVSPGSRAQAGS